jgi:hypothetical protein
MFLRRIIDHLRVQNWTAIAIDFVIVVIGVFIGMQVSNWNAERKEKAETQRMLAQLIPELQSQLEFFDSVNSYFATTRRYADQAFAGWKHDPGISDEQFVIAAYQASQITGIAINPDSWSLTFGGEQLRNIDDPRLRRTLELVLTSDYSVVEYTAVATAYREQVRHVIPTDIQDAIRRDCGDRNVRGAAGAFVVSLPPKCDLKLEPAEAAGAAEALRARPDLSAELNWHLAAIAAYRQNVDVLEQPMRELYQQLKASS